MTWCLCGIVDYTVNAVKVRDHLNYSHINLIPVTYIEPEISEQFAMDYNDLIYNIGGTVGMWIRVSMLSFNLVVTNILGAVPYVLHYLYVKLCIRFCNYIFDT